MTRAKDISKIVSDANFGGTLDVAGETTLATHLNLGDGGQIKLGNGSDLRIFHDGNNSYIDDVATGDLYIRSNKIRLQKYFGENYLVGSEDGAVELYHNNVKKIETDSSGVTVTGISVSDGMSTNTSGTSNFIAGVNAGNSITSGGNFNVVVGDEAGTAITSGGQNTAVGYQSLSGGVASYYNTAIGYQALLSDTTGRESVAVGRNALRTQNDTSSSSTYNTAVGANAGYAVTTGTSNTLIGGLAGDALTTGGNNVAVGLNALGANTNSYSNIAIGVRALEVFNVTNGTSPYNVAVGEDAGADITTGIQNTIIGGLAGDAITTGSSNIIIGYNVDAPSNTASNQLNIGNMIIAKDNGKVISYGKGSNGFTYKEVMLSGSKSVAHGVWTAVAFIDHTHCALVKLLLSAANRGTLVGSMSTSYGSSQYTNHTISLNNLTTLDFRYNNSGYNLEVYQTNSSSAARDIYFSWTGMSTGTPALL